MNYFKKITNFMKEKFVVSTKKIAPITDYKKSANIITEKTDSIKIEEMIPQLRDSRVKQELISNDAHLIVNNDREDIFQNKAHRNSKITLLEEKNYSDSQINELQQSTIYEIENEDISKISVMSDIASLISTISRCKEIYFNQNKPEESDTSILDNRVKLFKTANLLVTITNQKDTESKLDRKNIVPDESAEKIFLIYNIATLISTIADQKENHDVTVHDLTGSESLEKIITQNSSNAEYKIEILDSNSSGTTKEGVNKHSELNENQEIVYYYHKNGIKEVITMTNLTPKVSNVTSNDRENENSNSDLDINYNEKKEFKEKKQAIVSEQETKNKIQTLDSKNNNEEFNPLDFLDEEFEDDLDKIINAKDFVKRSTELLEIPKFKDNKEYITDFQSRDGNIKKALEMLVYANQGLVYSIVKHYKNQASPAFTEDDMFQHGMIGLIKAARKFDLDKGFEFSTYSTHWIRQEITRGILNNSNTVRIPVHMGELVKKIKNLEVKSDISFGFVDYEWISNELKVPLDKVINAVRVRNTFMNNISVDTPVGAEQSSTLGDFIEDRTVPDLDTVIFDKELTSLILSLLDSLTLREKDVIIKRFGLDHKGIRTLESIAQEYNLTRERIRQIESKALVRLKHPTRKTN